MKNISVLVPVYGVEKYIEKFALSLFSNTIAFQCEFIFVNDKTKDNSIVILNNIIKQFPQLDIKIIEHEENRGIAAARNTGLKNATCDYIIFVDSDDWVEPDYIEVLYNTAITTHSDIVMCGYVTELKNNSVKEFNTFNNEYYDPLRDLLYDRIPGYLWHKLIKRSLFTENNFTFTEGLNVLEDVYICTQLFYKAKKISLVEKYLYHYRMSNDNSIIHVKNTRHYNDSIRNLMNIYEFLKNNNISSNYKNEIIYRINIFKIEFLKRHYFNKRNIYKVLSENDITFYKNNLNFFTKKKKIFVYLLGRKMFKIANLLGTLICAKKHYLREPIECTENEIDFFLAFNEY